MDAHPGISNGVKVIFLSLYLALGATSVVNKSPVYDETLHLADGITYHKTRNFRCDIEHPPLARFIAGFAGFFTKVALPPISELERSAEEIRSFNWSPGKDFVYADKLFFRMTNRTDALFFIGRMLLLLLGIPAALLLCAFAKELYGENASILTLALFCLSPNILAHAPLVTTDFANVVFTLSASYFLWKFSLEPDLKRLLPSALLWGLSLSSKHTALFYFPVFYITALVLCGEKKKFLLLSIGHIPVIVFIINLSYLFTEPVGRNFFIPSEFFALGGVTQSLFVFFSKILLLPEIYLKGIIYSFSHSQRGHSAYLLGMHSIKGWFYYFPLAFIIKSTVTTLLLATISLFTLKKKRLMKGEIYFIVPSILFLFFMMRSHLNIGIRHTLILWPFMFLFSARAAALKPKLTIFFIAAALGENLLIYPDYLSQINIMLGGAKNGYKYLGDSNLDWGQDLKLLAKWWEKEGQPALVLSYFGTGSPSYYGIKYQGCLITSPVLPQGSQINPPEAGREFFASSVTNLQGIYFAQKDLFSYFLRRKPDAVCGKSIYIYDITNDASAHFLFASIYKWQNKTELSEREFKKYRRLSDAG